MKRRQVLFGIAGIGVLLSTPFDSSAQHRGKPVIGLLDAGERLAWWDEFRKQLHELGYVEGKNVALETRFARSNLAELPALAQDLVRLRVDAIVTASVEAALAA